MPREGRKVNTFLSDEEELDDNFMMRCAERSKLRRKTPISIVTDDAASSPGLPTGTNEPSPAVYTCSIFAKEIERALAHEKDGRDCTPEGTTCLPDCASPCKEGTRVAPGEIDSDWPEEPSQPVCQHTSSTLYSTFFSPACTPNVPQSTFFSPNCTPNVPQFTPNVPHKRFTEPLASGCKATTPSLPTTTTPRSSPPPTTTTPRSSPPPTTTTPRSSPPPTATTPRSSSGSAAANIQVACRFRPLISREVKAGDSECCVSFCADTQEKISTDGATVELSGRTFSMDRVFPPSALQSEVYEAVARPIVQDVLEGYNGTVMAYGSTGSGKTYTMEGRVGDPELLGIIPRMVSTLFDGIDQAADTLEFTLKMSAVEIYMERIIDLLCEQSSDDDTVRKKVKVREDPIRGVWVDAVEKHAANEADVFAVAHAAQASRRVAATHMNVRSSRSHYILMLRLTALNKQTGCERQGVLYLVDLAGSEKVSQTGAAGQTLEEAKKINRSLSCLGNVIVALTDQTERQHIPYRDSKLTRVLQQSLGGNAKTALIATCSLATSSLSEAVTTLRFAERVKSVRNTPKVNEQRSMEQLLRDLNDSSRTIEALKRDLASLRENASPPSPTRSIGTSANFCEFTTPQAQVMAKTCSTVGTDGETVVEDTPKDEHAVDDVLSELLAPNANKALTQMKHELNAMRQERDIAYEQLNQLRVEVPKPTRPAPGEEPDCSNCGMAVPSEVGSSMKMLEEENAALRFQVTSLAEARAVKAEQESKLKEEVLVLRDAAVRSSQEIDFLQREREELRQLLQTCCSGDVEEERRQWDEMLGNEVARREATSEQWRAYLSNRVHKVVELEIEVDFLRDALASLQLSPHQLGLDITTLAGSRRQPEVTGDDADIADLRGSWLERLQLPWSGDSSKAGRHANVAQPVVRRRRRQRSCERQLPKSPASRQFSGSPSPRQGPELPQKPDPLAEDAASLATTTVHEG